MRFVLQWTAGGLLFQALVGAVPRGLGEFQRQQDNNVRLKIEPRTPGSPATPATPATPDMPDMPDFSDTSFTMPDIPNVSSLQASIQASADRQVSSIWRDATSGNSAIGLATAIQANTQVNVNTHVNAQVNTQVNAQANTQVSVQAIPQVNAQGNTQGDSQGNPQGNPTAATHQVNPSAATHVQPGASVLTSASAKPGQSPSQTSADANNQQSQIASHGASATQGVGSGSGSESASPIQSADPVAQITPGPEPKTPSKITVNGTETEAYIYVPLTYYASEVCFNRWSWTTSANYLDDGLSIDPDKLQTIVLAQSAELSYGLGATQLPPASRSSMWFYNQPAWSGECSVPTYEIASISSSTETYAPNHSGLCKSIEFHFNGVKDAHGTQCEDALQGGFPASSIAAIVMSIIAFLFICGLVESWLTFRSLCLGKAARRGPPITFAFIVPFIACFILLMSSGGYAAKGPSEQEMLTRQWERLSRGQRFRYWLAWGFRWSYPPFLGREPLPKRNRVPADDFDNAPEVVMRSRLTSPCSDAATYVYEIGLAGTPRRQSTAYTPIRPSLDKTTNRESFELPLSSPKGDILVCMSSSDHLRDSEG